MGMPAAYVPKRDASPQRACFAKGYRAPKHTPQASFAPHVGIVQEGGTAFRPTPSAPSDKPTVLRSDVSVPRTSIGDGGELATRTSYRAPTTTIRQAIPGKGMVAIPSPTPQLPPPVVQKPMDLGGGEAQSPVPFLPTTPMIGLAADPNPFAPYCGNGIDAASELCRAASDAGLSDYCRQQLLAFLKSGSSQTLGSWIAAQELCDQAALRRAVGIAEASIASKTSAGLYDAPHAFSPVMIYGMPMGSSIVLNGRRVNTAKEGQWFDVGGAAEQYRLDVPIGTNDIVILPIGGKARGSRIKARGPNYAINLIVSQMPVVDVSPPSGGMPNYHRASGLVTDSGGGYTAAEIQAFNASQAGADLYRQELAQAAAAAPPASPPVDYAALIGGIGTAVGASLAGIGAIVNTQQQNRLRELEIEYANNARGAQLALQRSAMEMQTEIARLSAQSTPAAQATVTALQQQVADANARLNAAAAADQGMSPVTVGALVVGGVAALGTVAYVLMGKRR
jgi:hypothetical protein